MTTNEAVGSRPDAPELLRELLDTDPPESQVESGIALQRVGRVAILTLARPEQHNAIALQTWHRLAALVRSIADDDTVHAMVLRGAGRRALGAGADIKEFRAERMTLETATHYNAAVATGLSCVADLPMPTIAMVQGLAVGGALELSGACDVRIAADDARFGHPIGRLGVSIGTMEAWSVARHIGAGNLSYLLYSGALIDAERALRIGLVQDVVVRAELAQRVVDLVEQILSSSMPTFRASKAAIDACLQPITDEVQAQLALHDALVYPGEDLAEGVAAFLERRQPQFPSQARALAQLEDRSR